MAGVKCKKQGVIRIFVKYVLKKIFHFEQFIHVTRTRSEINCYLRSGVLKKKSLLYKCL